MAARDDSPSAPGSESPDEADDVIDETEEDTLDDEPATCLLCATVASSVAATMEHMKTAHSFDLSNVARQLSKLRM